MNRLKRVLIAGCGGILLATAVAAEAQSSGFYGKVDLGGNITQDIDVKEFLDANVAGSKMELDPGFRAGLAGGFQFTKWAAAEVELGFMGNNIKSVTGATEIHDAWFGNMPLLLNGKLQYPMGRCPVTPYAGAGVGFSEAILDVHHLEIQSGNTTFGIHGSDADTVFAWQAFAVLRYAINSQMGLSIEYRFFEADGPTWHADFTHGEIFNDTIKLGPTHTHSLSLAFDFHF